MSNEIFSYNGRAYVFDVDAIISYTYYSNNKEVNEKEITDGYDFDENGNIKITSKTVKEVVTPMDTQIDNIRYDLIKMFIVTIMNSDDEYETMSFGYKIAFDTLRSMGLIKEIKTIEDGKE